MRFPLLCIAAMLVALPAAAQNTKKAAPKVDPVVERAKQRCIAQHGVDCDTPEGLREWIIQDRQMTPEQQRSAAAARRVRASQTR